MVSPDFWKDPAVAAKQSSKFEANRKLIEAEEELGEVLGRVGERVSGLAGKYGEEGLEKELERAEEIVAWLESQTLFAGKFDDASAVMMFHVGTGGVDAADFNQMLLAMYLQYAKLKGWTATVVDMNENEEGGLKNATVKIDGYRAYGYLKAEAGVHRLIRISPFNAQGLRQTSFALIEVLPDLPDVDVEIADKDLKVETYRASGHGGQSVNTTDSAVRITHIPSNISVAIQNERSQGQNKEMAMRILKSKLFILEEEKRETETRKMKAANSSGDFGQQIRTYTLHPYQQVKDSRSGFETAKVNDVLKNGELDEIIMSVLMAIRGADSNNADGGS
jgi:peptide chain release factor 2